MCYNKFFAGEDFGVTGAKETWLQHCQLVQDDLVALQSAPYNVFWSQQIFDRDLRRHFSRLLKRLPRSYDKDANYPDQDVKEAIRKTANVLFRVLVRMSTYKESRTDFMSPEYFSRLIYDHFLFDVPRILDICSLFNEGNKNLLEKVVMNLFKQQPKYLQDVKSVSMTIMEAFNVVSAKVLDSFASRLNIKAFEDLVIYAADLSYTIGEPFPCI